MALKITGTFVKFIVIGLFTLLPPTGYAASLTIKNHYDDLNRFVQEEYEGGKMSVYEYDEVGNRTAKYTAYTITVLSGSGGNVAVPLTAPSGVKIIKEGTTVSITPNAHYHISNVMVNVISQGAVSSYTFNNVIAAPTIEAQFTIDIYPLNVSLNNGTWGTITSSIAGINCGTDCTETYTYGTSVTLTATPNTAYNFTGWSGACTGTGACAITMDASKNVTANFSLKTFGIGTFASFTSNYPPDYNWQGGGSITPVGATVPYGSSQTFNITPADGNRIYNVWIDGVALGAVTNYTFVNVTAPHQLVAQFYYNYNTYPLNVSLSNSAWGFATSPSGIYCGMGATTCSALLGLYTWAKVTTQTDYGYSLSFGGAPCYEGIIGVSSNENGVAKYISTCSMRVGNQQTLSYAFSPLSAWPINANSIGAGSITPYPRTVVPAGSSKTFTITPSNGATLSDVIVDGTSVGPVSSYSFYNITNYHNITAQFSCPNLPVRIAGSVPAYYSTLQAAYNAAVNGSVIQTVEGLVDNINFNRDISVTLDGGYNCTYTSNSGKTTMMKGAMTTAAGTLSLMNFTLIQ